jgi:hypothetical protein
MFDDDKDAGCRHFDGVCLALISFFGADARGGPLLPSSLDFVLWVRRVAQHHGEDMLRTYC